MARKTAVYAGYFLSMQELEYWSSNQAKLDPVYADCLSRGLNMETQGMINYMSKKKLRRQLGFQVLQKPEHGACDVHCEEENFLFYRRHALTPSLAKFHSWHKVVETPADAEIKVRLGELGLKLSEWSIIAWGPTGVVYDLTPEAFQEKKDEIMKTLEQAGPGPCPPGKRVQ